MRWLPAPDDLIRDADRQRYTRENPAPALVGYCVLWSTLRDGGRWSVSRLAEHLGWSKYFARQMTNRVQQDLKEWRARFEGMPIVAPESETNSQEIGRNSQEIGRSLVMIPGGYGDASNELTNGSETFMRARIATDTKTEQLQEQLTTEPSPASGINVSEVWKRVETLRGKHLPGCKRLNLTKGRRKILKARVAEHGEEAIVLVWKWALTSRHTRAQYLREQGYVRPDTLHRASKFALYFEMAQEQEVRNEPESTSSGSGFDEFLADKGTG